MKELNEDFKWLTNIRAAIYSLTIAGGVREHYDDFTMVAPVFGYDETSKIDAFYRFNRRGVEALAPFIPYVLHPVWLWDTDKDGNPHEEPHYKNHIWLNRFYKPLGYRGNFCDYEEFKDFQIGSDSEKFPSVSGIFEMHEHHAQQPIYYCYRKLESKKQVKELIGKLIKLLSLFGTEKPTKTWLGRTLGAKHENSL